MAFLLQYFYRWMLLCIITAKMEPRQKNSSGIRCVAHSLFSDRLRQ